MIHTSLYISSDVYKCFTDKIEVSHILFYSQTYLRLANLSEQDYGCFGVVNKLIREVSVPRHLLNDTNIFYISHVMCATPERQNLSGAYNFYSQTYLRLAV